MGGQPISSDEPIAMSGVQQETILGPTLFLVHIKNIFNDVDNNMHLLTDNTKLLILRNLQQVAEPIEILTEQHFTSIFSYQFLWF